MSFVVREATAADVEQIRAILDHYVRTTCVTWRGETPSLEELAAKYAARVAPWLVATPAENEREVVGLAYASLFREIAGWRRTCEDSVYVRPGFERRGLGSLLLKRLIQVCCEANFTVIMALISVLDGSELGQSSIALHKQLGFESSGLVKRCGFKFGQWMDCAFLSLQLGE
jgi:L-amino acid N-acyltransferase YncA